MRDRNSDHAMTVLLQMYFFGVFGKLSVLASLTLVTIINLIEILTSLNSKFVQGLMSVSFILSSDSTLKIALVFKYFTNYTL